MSENTYDQFWANVQREHSAQNNWRLGQHYFNTLARIRPTLAADLALNGPDPFYFDYVAESTHFWVRNKW